MSLPVEARAVIYDAYFSSVQLHLFSRRGIPNKAAGTPLRCRSNVKDGNTLTVLAVAKAIREEALSSLNKLNIEISVMVSSWPQFDKDVLGIHAIHAIRIQTISLAFLDSNYSLLSQLPSLKHVVITPSGEFSCRRPSIGDRTRLWNEADISGSLGLEAMRTEIFDHIKLMKRLLEISQKRMAFDVSYDVGFKFLIDDIMWSHGRPNPKRCNYRSVVSLCVLRYSANFDIHSDAKQPSITTAAFQCQGMK